jgi:hypothetical protein
MSANVVRIKVTATDIARGKPHPRGCPIYRAAARACRAILGHPGVHLVGLRTIVFANGGFAVLPPEAVDFIREFDNGRSVQPIAFTLVG